MGGRRVARSVSVASRKTAASAADSLHPAISMQRDFPPHACQVPGVLVIAPQGTHVKNNPLQASEFDDYGLCFRVEPPFDSQPTWHEKEWAQNREVRSGPFNGAITRKGHCSVIELRHKK